MPTHGNVHWNKLSTFLESLAIRINAGMGEGCGHGENIDQTMVSYN